MAFLVFFALLFLGIFLWRKLIKIPKFGNMVLVTGGVKTGKSTMSVWLAVRQYHRMIIKYYLNNKILYPAFSWIPFGPFKRMKLREYPLFYSNIPVAVKGYVPLTHALMTRQDRFRYGSVIYVCESSLVADSMSFKNECINEQMLLLNKLIAHETRGGYIFYDTQSVSDNHFAVRRCLSTYFYIHHARKIPFYYLAWVRELKYSDDQTSVNTFETDVEDTLQLVIIPKKVWSYFDCYCYSVLTDELPVEDRQVKIIPWGDRKARRIVTFKNFRSVPKENLSVYEEKDQS